MTITITITKKMIIGILLISILSGSFGFLIAKAVSDPLSVTRDSLKYCHKVTTIDISVLPLWIQQYLPKNATGGHDIYIC